MDSEQKARLQVLMVRLADGDRTAFEPIYEALWPVVRRFAERTLSASPDAEDAAQVAFMKVFSRVSEFDPRRAAVTWVLGVAAHECTFRQKQRRRREDAVNEDQRPASEPSPEAVMVRDLHAAVGEVLGDLTASDAATLRAVARGPGPVLHDGWLEVARAFDTVPTPESRAPGPALPDQFRGPARAGETGFAQGWAIEGRRL